MIVALDIFTNKLQILFLSVMKITLNQYQKSIQRMFMQLSLLFLKISSIWISYHHLLIIIRLCIYIIYHQWLFPLRHLRNCASMCIVLMIVLLYLMVVSNNWLHLSFKLIISTIGYQDLTIWWVYTPCYYLFVTNI